MKKLFLACLILSAASCWAEEKLTVGATAVPHAEILEFVKPLLAKDGVTLDIKVFTDYVQPNVQVAAQKLDANFFQHQQFLDEFNKTKDTDLIAAANVHIEPLGIYSAKHGTLDTLAAGTQVVIPNDPTNRGRALLLLQKAGLIKLDSNKFTVSPRDIVKNPHRLKITELEAAMLPRVLKQVDLALINTNFALPAGLDPRRDALMLEDNYSPYVNIVAIRRDRAADAALKKLAAALTSPETKKFIEEKYKGAVVPVF